MMNLVAFPVRYSEDFAELLSEKMPHDEVRNTNLFSVQRGRKYDKIVRDRSVYAFVNVATGELIKAASFNKPAMNKFGETAGKYFLNTEEDTKVAIFNADQYGGFLYNNYPVRKEAK